MLRPRRATVLLLVLVSLVLLAAWATPLATLSGATALESTDRANAPRHRLAVESMLALLPHWLARDARLAGDLERSNRAILTFDLPDLHVEALLQDDTAKLPLPLLAEVCAPAAQRAALSTLQTTLALPTVGILGPWASDGRPIDVGRWSGCLEDLFAGPTDRALYGRPAAGAAWVQYVTPVGRVLHAYRADPAVLEAALEDLEPGLGTRLATARGKQVLPDVEELLSSLELPATTRQAARQRLTTESERYSLLVRTELGSDVRQHYLVCTAANPPAVLLMWEVAP